MTNKSAAEYIDLINSDLNDIMNDGFHKGKELERNRKKLNININEKTVAELMALQRFEVFCFNLRLLHNGHLPCHDLHH